MNVQHKFKWRSIYKVKFRFLKKVNKKVQQKATKASVSNRTKKQNQRWGLINNEISTMKSLKKGERY